MEEEIPNFIKFFNKYCALTNILKVFVIQINL